MARWLGRKLSCPSFHPPNGQPSSVAVYFVHQRQREVDDDHPSLPKMGSVPAANLPECRWRRTGDGIISPQTVRAGSKSRRQATSRVGGSDWAFALEEFIDVEEEGKKKEEGWVKVRYKSD